MSSGECWSSQLRTSEGVNGTDTTFCEMSPGNVAAVPLACSLLALLAVVWLKKTVASFPRGEDLDLPGKGAEMNALSDTIQEGARFAARPALRCRLRPS